MGHDDATVLIVSVAVATLATDTVVLGIEKHPFESDGLLEVAHEMTPE